MRTNLLDSLNGDVCRFILRLLSLSVLWLPLVISTQAQSTGGRIRGTVTDPSGGAVISAKLVLTNEANGTQRVAESGANGEYIFLEVPVGTDQLDINQQSFKKSLPKALWINLNEVVCRGILS